MSRKSQSVADSVLTVRVRVVPSVFERKKMRRTADAPATVRVPLMVWSPPSESCIKPAEAGAVTVRLLNVHDDEIVFVDAVVPVNATL